MEKYTCLDCGHNFEGDLSTMQCPSCGSSNIKRAGGVPWKYVGIVVAVVCVIIFIFAISGGDDKLEATLQLNSGTIVIEVDGVSATKLDKDYKVVVYDQSNKEHGVTPFVKKKNIAQYSTLHLMEGQSYSFNIERKDGASIKNLRWKTSNVYNVPVAPVKPEIDHIDTGVADHVNLVWNNIKVVMKKKGNFSYSIIAGNFQDDSVFNNIKPGDYTIVVKNEESVTDSQPILLNNIEKLDPPLTLKQVQDIFNKVSAKKMGVSEAHDKLGKGNVGLAKSIDGVESLYGALFEAYMGQKYKVNSFENDQNTNKIKSGTLNLSKE